MFSIYYLPLELDYYMVDNIRKSFHHFHLLWYNFSHFSSNSRFLHNPEIHFSFTKPNCTMCQEDEQKTQSREGKYVAKQEQPSLGISLGKFMTRQVIHLTQWFLGRASQLLHLHNAWVIIFVVSCNFTSLAYFENYDT